MVINILHDCVLFREYTDALSKYLVSKGHKVYTSKEFINNDADVTLSMGFLNIKDELLRKKEEIKQYKGVFVHWFVEIAPLPGMETEFNEMRAKQFDELIDAGIFQHIFVRDQRQIEAVQKRFRVTPAGVLSCCPNPELHKKVPCEKKHDVLFYGNMTKRRERLINELTQKGIKVHIPEAGTFWYDQKIKTINESKIILNIHADETDAFETFRFTECLASGGFLLTETMGWYPEGIQESRDFVQGPYHGLADRIFYYLDNAHERRRIADTGYRTIQNFTWDKEWAKIEALVNPSLTNEDQFLKDRKYFIILGSQRSGTTLMELMTDSHPDIKVTGEPGGYEKLAIWKDPKPLDKVLGFKLPMWNHRHDFFKIEYPNAKIIFMRRDIKSVAASMKSLVGWIEHEMDREIQATIRSITSSKVSKLFRNKYDNLTNDNRKILGPALCAYIKQYLVNEYKSKMNTLTVNYAELVTNPEKTMKDVLEFIGVDWNEAVLQHNRHHKGFYMGGTDSQRSVDTSSMEKWKKVFTQDQADSIDFYIKDLENEIEGGEQYKCPVCLCSGYAPYGKRKEYKICEKCGHYRQFPLPPKIYEGTEENFGNGPGTGDLMSDRDKSINEKLAQFLINRFHPENVLDIGTKYPYLLKCMKPECKSVLGMDAIEDVIKYGAELDVPVIQADFESTDLSNYEETFDLITLIHMAEHVYDIPNFFTRLFKCLKPGGHIFIRTPDPSVSGIEKDLSDHHLSIHPNLFTNSSMQKLADLFGYEIQLYSKMEGFGQSDYILGKKGEESKSLSICMIVKNEEKNIRDCLDSLKMFNNEDNELIIVDTGSTDKTKEVCLKYGAKIHDFEWIDDFSAARNFSLSFADRSWVMWMDADDILKNPEEVMNLIESKEADAYNFNILYGNDQFCHARLFRNNRGAHFRGRVHEAPILDGLFLKEKTQVNVQHKTEKHSTENRTLRNYRILKKDVEEHPKDSRALFYYGNTLKDLGKMSEAIAIYHRYLAVATWQDEKWMAQKYIAQILQGASRYKEAIAEWLRAIATDDKWAESYYYLGECYYLLGDYHKCLLWMKMASDIPLHNSILWKELPVYRDLPYRYMFACSESLQDYPQALKYAERALEKNPEDNWLKERVEYFKTLNSSKVIECYRAGALGDCLMTTSALRILKKENPDHKIRFITHPKSFPILEGNKYIDELTDTPGLSERKIYFCYPDKDSKLKDEGYPDKPLSRHIVDIFNECAGVEDLGHNLECTLSDEDAAYAEKVKGTIGDYVTLHAKAGWSPYKEWGDNRWGDVADRIEKELNHKVLLLGHQDDPLIPHTLNQKGIGIKRTVALIKKAKVHIGIDSFTNHASQAVGTPSVILFGSTSPTGSGYDRNTNIWKGLECSPCYREYEWAKDPKGECPHNKKCMNLITIEEVFEEIKKLI